MLNAPEFAMLEDLDSQNSITNAGKHLKLRFMDGELEKMSGGIRLAYVLPDPVKTPLVRLHLE